MTLLTYHEELPGFPDQRPLIDLWRRSWERMGFSCVVLAPALDKGDPWMTALDNEWKAWLGNSVNQWAYTRACYRRWRAYVLHSITGDVAFCDYDVINRSVTPQDMRSVPARLWLGDRTGVPCLGRADRTVIAGVCRMFRNAAVLRQAGRCCVRDDISDMNLIRDFAEIECGDLVALPNEPQAETAKAIHFSNHVCPGDRIEAALAWYDTIPKG